MSSLHYDCRVTEQEEEMSFCCSCQSSQGCLISLRGWGREKLQEGVTVVISIFLTD